MPPTTCKVQYIISGLNNKKDDRRDLTKIYGYMLRIYILTGICIHQN